jgi:hypothetical protein
VWRVDFTPHDLRAVYATHRMDLCHSPGAFRQLMRDMGWLSPATILRYDRPKELDLRAVREDLIRSYREGEAHHETA